MRLFDVEATERDGGGVTLTLSGELDLSTIEQLERAIDSSVDGKREAVVLDLRKLVFLDSTGLRVMLQLHSRLQAAGGRLVLVRGPRRVHMVFELTGSLDVLEIVSDPSELDAEQGRSAGSA